MFESKYRWRNRQIREHVEVLDGRRSPTILLINATFLHGILKKWVTANIWIYHDRIVYVGEKWPEMIDERCEIVDCKNDLLVPGYIEPHAHPSQLYNPLSLAQYASQYGTTTLINDNLHLALSLDKKEAFSFIQEIHSLPVNMYWWSRYDSQTTLENEEEIFSNLNICSWLAHDNVLQGGELTSWPRLVDGDDMILYWIQETKRLNKKVEGHFPGASEKTLAKLKLLGADGDHEAISGKEVERRLLQGYMVTLRHSSIRPDLPKLLDEMKELGLDLYENYLLTTDGSMPSFYDKGITNSLLSIAMEKGVPPIEAYLMATLNPAKYYNMVHIHGLIATGRVADINFLHHERDPLPHSVISKGIWVKKKDQVLYKYEEPPFPWEQFGVKPLQFDWDITVDDLSISIPFGIQLENNVITKPYSPSYDLSVDRIDADSDECFFIFIDRKGKWRVTTVIKGFAKNIGGLVSSYTSSGDIVLIGKNKSDLLIAFKRMKELGGGLVLVENGETIFELALPLLGQMSKEPMEKLIEAEKKFKSLLKERGYPYGDPLYSILFFSATHLPYVRVTPIGVYDVKQKRVLFPSVMR